VVECLACVKAWLPSPGLPQQKIHHKGKEYIHGKYHRTSRYNKFYKGRNLVRWQLAPPRSDVLSHLVKIPWFLKETPRLLSFLCTQENQSQFNDSTTLMSAINLRCISSGDVWQKRGPHDRLNLECYFLSQQPYFYCLSLFRFILSKTNVILHPGAIKVVQLLNITVVKWMYTLLQISVNWKNSRKPIIHPGRTEDPDPVWLLPPGHVLTGVPWQFYSHSVKCSKRASTTDLWTAHIMYKIFYVYVKQ
jgi:hypothetical protein